MDRLKSFWVDQRFQAFFGPCIWSQIKSFFFIRSFQSSLVILKSGCSSKLRSSGPISQPFHRLDALTPSVQFLRAGEGPGVRSGSCGGPGLYKLHIVLWYQTSPAVQAALQPARLP